MQLISSHRDVWTEYQNLVEKINRHETISHNSKSHFNYDAKSRNYENKNKGKTLKWWSVFINSRQGNDLYC